MSKQSPSCHGFTLIELIMVIVVTGVIATMISVFIRQPVEGYYDLARRAELVDAAESALRLMARDIRRALPNSLRCNNNCSGATAIEMINTVDAVRYRLDPPGSQAQRLRFNAADASFNSIGPFNNITKPFNSAGHRLVVYNLGAAGADAYDETTAVITPNGTTFSIDADVDPAHPGEDQVVLSAAHRFSYESPRQRLFLIDGPISYICDAGAGLLRRYTGYALQSTQPIPPGVASVPVAGHLAACSIDYQPGTATRAGLITLALTLTSDGESVRLLHQVHVDNVP